MSLEHIHEVYSSMVFPPDACLANAFYFVKMEFHNFDEKVFIYYCLMQQKV